MANIRLGNQKPTRELVLPFKKSDGKKAIELYKKTKREIYPWQETIVNRILAKNEDGLWTHSKFGYSVPRQNGKNEIVAIVELYALHQGLRVIHTAHRTSTSHKAWERLCALLDESNTEYDSLKASGREMVELPTTNGRVEFRTRTTLGGLGESFDLLIIDEAQEYTDDQESALIYTIAASPNPQTIMTGTPPTPHSSGMVFSNLRTKALTEETEDTGWAEWSVPEESDVNDRDLWYLTNPSLGYRVTERAVKAEIRGDDIDFNIQRLGLWLKYNQQSAITEVEWNALTVEELPNLVGKLFVGIKYGVDGQNVAMSIAVKTESEKIFIETIDCRPARAGNNWILKFLLEADYEEVIVDGASGQGTLEKEMQQLELGSLIKPKVSEFITANSEFEQGIYQEQIQHMNQPSLAKVATNSDKRAIGSNGGFGYKSQLEEFDIVLLDSAILAYWGCKNSKPVKKKQRIIY